MTCQYCERYLLYYLLGELSPHDRSRMEQHIPDCVTCSEELKVLARDLTTISEAIATNASAPDSMLPAIRQRLSQERSLGPARQGWFSTRLRPAHVVGMLAAFGAVFAATWFGGLKPAVRAVTLPALVSDREQFLGGDDIDSLKAGTPAEAAQAVSPHIETAAFAIEIPVPGLSFRGYAERVIERCPVALLVYAHDGGNCVSVYEYSHDRCALENELDKRQYRGKTYRAGSMNGTTTVAWQRANTTIALVSDCSLDQALAQAEAARKSLPGEGSPPSAE